jgi:hypothetical protein
MTLAKDKSIGGKVYWKDDTKYYMEYTVQGGIDTGLMQIARDRLKDQKLYTQALYKDILWLDKGIPKVIQNKDKIDKGQMLLLPVDAPAAPTPPPVSDAFTLTSERNVRSEHVKDDKNLLYTATADPSKKFKYSKNTLFTDPAGLVWAEVELIPPKKDKTGTEFSKGWICVTNGTEYYSDPHIEPPKPDLG